VQVILFGGEEGAAEVCDELRLRHEPHVWSVMSFNDAKGADLFPIRCVGHGGAAVEDKPDRAFLGWPDTRSNCAAFSPFSARIYRKLPYGASKLFP